MAVVLRIYEVKYEDFSLEGFDPRDVEQVLADHFPCWGVGDGVLFSVDAEQIEEILDEGEGLTGKERKILEALKAEAEKREGRVFDLMCLY